jgi:hypothetical protein
MAKQPNILFNIYFCRHIALYVDAYYVENQLGAGGGGQTRKYCLGRGGGRAADSGIVCFLVYNTNTLLDRK